MSKYRENPIAFKEGNKASERPEGVLDEHLEYLDELRDSGATNMFGAMPYLMDDFEELSEPEASKILGYWMKSFGDPNH